MDEEKPDLPVVPQKQSKEEAAVHHPVAMDVEEGAVTQEVHNNAQELVATPNSKEQAVARDAAAVADIVEGGTQDAAMQEDEEWGGIGRLLPAAISSGEEEEEEEEEEAEGHVELFQRTMTLEEWLYYFRGDLPPNTDAPAAAADAAAEAEESDEESYMDDTVTMQVIQRSEGRPLRALASPFAIMSEPLTEVSLAAPADAPATSARQVPFAGAAPRAFSFSGTEQEGPNNNVCAVAMPAASAIDPATSTMQALFASINSRAVFPGMEEEEDNGWYDSIARDAQMMEEMEEEDPGLDGTTIPSPLHLPISMAPKDIRKILGVTPLALGPDEPGPSTRILQEPRVPPLDDDEVPKFDCGICMETLPIFDLFHGMPCPHRFCGPCMGKYIESKIRAGEVPVPCPDPACKEEGGAGGVLHPEDCKKSIDFAVFCSWSDQLTERAIPPGQRVYCPNRACGVMLESSCGAGNKAPAQVPCPACNCLMCATCGLEWSSGGSGQHDCGEGTEDMLVKRLAAQRHWKQCPCCRMLVERTIGCSTMTCKYSPLLIRCRAVFCYTCGRPMVPVLDGVGPCRCHNFN